MSLWSLAAAAFDGKGLLQMQATRMETVDFYQQLFIDTSS
jgi:hypothetical protein